MPRRTPEDAAKTRETILDAGLRVFAELGFAAAQLEEIAKRAGVTRGAFYHHFTNKADLYGAILRERWTSVMAPVLDVLCTEGEPAAKIHGFVASFLRAVQTDPQMQALMQMSLSGDLSLPDFRDDAGIAHKQGALEELTISLAKVLEAAGHSADALDRARTIVIFLNGAAVSATLHPASVSAAPERLAALFLDGVL
ncbi:TetR family transcriptional regulator [Pendulispora brunnea]|uniref:TetR family transcriptional regulator n=1 Tax=Pendulispora brunnea TaxID=2905690 RepID=A0ABZ2KMX6_9BACT